MSTDLYSHYFLLSAGDRLPSGLAEITAGPSYRLRQPVMTALGPTMPLVKLTCERNKAPKLTAELTVRSMDDSGLR